MKSDSHFNFEAIIANFSVEGRIKSVVPFGSGHINGSFHLKNADSAHPDYLLQAVNSYVFKNVPALIKNIKQVTDHLRKQVIAEKGNPATEVLTLVDTKDNQSYYKDEEGTYWRMYVFLKGTKSYDILETSQQAYQGGKAFGKFQYALSDMDASLLSETIPNFHHIGHRLHQLELAISNDLLQRTKHCQAEIDFISERVEKMKTILLLGESGALPLRVIHNDTKFNNILFDSDDHVQCIIDLDTVMPGFAAYDFGDAIRTVINKAAEDEADLSKIELHFELFKAYTKGYLEEAMRFLNPAEVQSLIHGVLLLPYMQAVRFLTDYIMGDQYFKIHFAEHNLQRTKAQLKLVKEIEDNQMLLQQYIDEVKASF